MRGVSRHEEVLKYFKDFNLYHMRMPTRKEMMHDLKIGNGSINRILNRLVEKKLLKRIPERTLPYKVL